ncbi:MAG: DUF1269 domain-containing protein [Cyanobacteria bacterium]|nr:DUF1269 domain-containing protein [Cyanobacteriota bacterium]MDA0867088.1 DUF1269 domain-containing protein [Cyanobacteriota bacterium]
MVNHEFIQHAAGVFSSKAQLEAAVEALKSKGFPLPQMSVVAKGAAEEGSEAAPVTGVQVQETIGNKSADSARTGAVVGGIGGVVLGAAESLGAATVLALLPGAGQVLIFGTVAANALATAVLGGVTGAAGGGLIGGLLGWGVPEKQTKLYQDRVADGQFLLMLEGTATQIEDATQVLNPYGVQEWGVYQMQSQAATVG